MDTKPQTTGHIHTVYGPNKLVLVTQLPENTHQFTALFKNNQW